MLPAVLLGMSVTAQGMVMSSEKPVAQLEGTGYWVETSVDGVMVMNSTVVGQRLELQQEVVSSDASARLTISGVDFLESGHGDACSVIYAQGVTIDSGSVTVSTLSSKVLDGENKVLVQGSEGVVLELQNGACLSGGSLGRYGLAGSSVVVDARTYFARGVDVLEIGAGNTATLKDMEAHVECALDMTGGTLVLDNASLVLGTGATGNAQAGFTVNNPAGDKNHITIQTGQEALNQLNLAVRPVVDGTIMGTGRLENVRMQGGSLQIGAADAYGTLAIKDVVVLKNGSKYPRWTFNINAGGDFNFSGANKVGGTNFSQLKVEEYGNHGQSVSITLNYLNGSQDDLAGKFERGAAIRLINLENGALSGNCFVDYENLPTLADGLAWYTQELFLTGDLVVVDAYLNAMAIGLEDLEGEGAQQIRVSELEKIALDNQSKDAARLANSLATAAAATSAFGQVAMGHADDVRRWKSNIWFSGVYSSQSYDSTGSHAGYDNSTFGYAVGADTYLDKYHSIVGAALGVSSGTLNPASGNRYYNAGEIEQDGVQLGLYGRMKVGGQGYYERGYTVDAFISYGMYDCKSSRSGYKNGDSVIGCWDENAWSMGVTVSREYQWQRGIVVTGFAGFEYTTAEMDDLREMGYTAFDYSCEQEHRNLAVFAGARAHRVFQLQRGQSLIPFASLSLGMDMYREYARVVGRSASGSVEGEATHPGRCFLKLGLGTDWIMGRTWSADAGYSLEMRDAAVEHQLHIGASHSF